MKQKLIVVILIFSVIVCGSSQPSTTLQWNINENGELEPITTGNPEFENIQKIITFANAKEPKLDEHITQSLKDLWNEKYNDLDEDASTEEITTIQQDIKKDLSQTNPEYAPLLDNRFTKLIEFATSSNAKQINYELFERNHEVLNQEGNAIAKIPYALDIQNNNGVLELTQNDDSGGIATSLLEGLELDGKKLKIRGGSKVTYANQNGIKEIVIEDGQIEINDNIYHNIRNANFKINNEDELLFAEFTASKRTLYSFSYKDKEYDIITNKDGTVRFDPLENEIATKDSEIEFSSKKIVSSESTLSLNEEGEVKRIDIAKEGKVIEPEGYVLESAEDFSVIYEKEEFEKTDGNAIFMPREIDASLEFKGKVAFTKDSDSKYKINFNGLSEDSHARFDPTENNFVIYSGDSEFGNGKHGIVIDDGNIKLKVQNLNLEGESETFSFTQKGEENDFYGVIDEENSRFDLFLQKEGEKEIVKSMTLSTFEQKALLSKTSSFTARDFEKKFNELVLSGELSLEEESVLSSVLLDKKNQASIADENYDEAISRTKEFIESIEASDIEKEISERLINDARLSLAEIYKTQSLELEEEFESLSFEARENSRDLYSSLKDEAKENNNYGLYAEASLGLAELYSSRSSSDALSEYDEMIDYLNQNSILSLGMQGEEKENFLKLNNDYISKAYEGKSIINLKEGDVIASLNELSNSLNANPNNLYAKELQRKIQLDILSNVDSKLFSELNSLDDIVQNKIHLTRDIGLGISNENIVDLQRKISDEIFLQKDLVSKAKQFLEFGDLSEYYSINGIENKKDYIAQSLGLRYAVGDASYEIERLRVDEMHTALEKIKSINPDVNALYSGEKIGNQFTFNTGERYVDLEELGSLSDDLLSQVNMVNALAFVALPSGARYTFQGAKEALSKVPLGAQLIRGTSVASESIAATVGGSRAVQFASELPYLGPGGKLLAEEIAESTFGYAVASVSTPQIGLVSELALSARGSTNVKQKVIDKIDNTISSSKIYAEKRAIKLGDGTVASGYKFASNTELKRFLDKVDPEFKRLDRGDLYGLGSSESLEAAGLKVPDNEYTVVYDTRDGEKIFLYASKGDDITPLMHQFDVKSSAGFNSQIEDISEAVSNKQASIANTIRGSPDEFATSISSDGLLAKTTPNGYWATNDLGNKFFVTTEKRTVPLGFKGSVGWEQYKTNTAEKIEDLERKLRTIGVNTKVDVGLQGSSVTGVSSKTGQYISTPNDFDVLIVNDQLFNVVMTRANDLALSGSLLKGKTVAQQVSYVQHFRNKGEAIITSPSLLPELPKTFLQDSKTMQSGISINQRIVTSSSEAAKKHTIFITKLFVVLLHV